MSAKLSVIIPVHNGEKTIKKTIEKILEQDYRNLELILVENGSTDSSWKQCKKLQREDQRIILLQSKTGTSLARKEGVLHSQGDFICFCDQDDYYINNKALSSMVLSAKHTEADIVQFNVISNIFGIKKKTSIKKSFIINRTELLEYYIGGILGAHRSIISTNVWSKIYSGKILRNAVSGISEALIMGEDMYFNAFAFLHPDVNRVAVDSNAYYVWNSGIGTSSAEKSGITLFDEYQIIKPVILQMAKAAKVGPQPIMYSHLETIYFLKNIVIQSVLSGETKEETICRFTRYTSMNFVIEAAEFFQTKQGNSDWNELIKQDADIWDAEAYYENVSSSIRHIHWEKVKYKSKNVAKNILKRLK